MRGARPARAAGGPGVTSHGGKARVPDRAAMICATIGRGKYH